MSACPPQYNGLRQTSLRRAYHNIADSVMGPVELYVSSAPQHGEVCGWGLWLCAVYISAGKLQVQRYFQLPSSFASGCTTRPAPSRACGLRHLLDIILAYGREAGSSSPHLLVSSLSL